MTFKYFKSDRQRKAVMAKLRAGRTVGGTSEFFINPKATKSEVVRVVSTGEGFKAYNERDRVVARDKKNYVSAKPIIKKLSKRYKIVQVQ